LLVAPKRFTAHARGGTDLIQAQAKEFVAYFTNLPEDERPTAIFTAPGKRNKHFYRSRISLFVPSQSRLRSQPPTRSRSRSTSSLVYRSGTRRWRQGQVCTHGQRLQTISSSTSRACSAQPNPPPPLNLHKHPRRPQMRTSARTGRTSTHSRNRPTSSRKGKSVAELYTYREGFLRAFVGRIDGQGPRLPIALPGGVGTVHSGSGDKGIGVGHAHPPRLACRAGHGPARVPTREWEVVQGMRVGCCMPTTLCQSSSSIESPPPPSSSSSMSTPTPIPGGHGVWTVRGTPADGEAMADVETHGGVVVGAAGIPGSGGEADGLHGLHVWWTTGTVPVPGLPLSLLARIGRGELLITAVGRLGAVLVTCPPSPAIVGVRANLGYRKLSVRYSDPLTTRCPARRMSGNVGLMNANDVEARYLHLSSRQLRMDLKGENDYRNIRCCVNRERSAGWALQQTTADD
jgi:hypothetical protein